MKTKYGCKCIANCNKELEKIGSNTRVDAVQVMNFKTGRMDTRMRIGTVKADSRKREPLKPIIAQFCPVCGNRYKKPKAVPKVKSEQ